MTASAVQLDVALFHKRLRLLNNHWKSAAKKGAEDALFQQAEVLFIATGDLSESSPYQKSTSIQNWLLGYEFPETVMAVSHEKVVFLTSVKKGGILEILNENASEKQTSVEVLKRMKNGSNDDEIFKSLEKFMDGHRIGVVEKDSFSGAVYDKAQAIVNNLTKVDVSAGLANCFAVKDEEEMKNLRTASQVSSLFMQNAVMEDILSIIDEEKSVSHESVAESIESYLGDERLRKKVKVPREIDGDFLEFCYTPIIQSGGKYNLKPSASSNEDKLHFGIITASVGIRFKSYCSNVGRTFMIDPNTDQERNYNFLLDLQAYILSCITDGVSCKEVFLKGLDYVRKNRPDLEAHLTKNFGFGIGLEFRETEFILNAKNENVLNSGMTLNLALGLQDLSNSNANDAKSQKYSLFLADTIKVTSSVPAILTEVPKRTKDISFETGEDEPEVKPEPMKKTKSAVLRSKLRADDNYESAESKRKEHQKELTRLKNLEMIEKFEKSGSNNKEASDDAWKSFESYRKDTFLPKEVKDNRIYVDKRSETIILPIYGLAVPFHISTVKNASKSEEGEFVYLRINLNSPGQVIGKKDQTNQFQNPDATFVRSFTFKSTDSNRINEICKDITDLKKAVAKRESEKKEMADLVEQDRLLEIKGRRPLRLGDVYMRPALEGKRVPGEVEIHQNGLRYQSQLKSDNRVDVLFSNVKHLFFQPCDKELIVLIHLHLKHHIMVGKKKTKDLQFYREVSDVAFDETGGRRRRNYYGDEDELAAEQEERKRRAVMNQEFKAFSEKIVDASNLEVDIPFRELGFYGVPFRQNVLLQPTTDCLVHLTDTPFFVVSLSEVEIAVLERVKFGLKNFDLVFIFKDHSLTPVHITLIGMESLEHIKDWLDSMDVVYAETAVNLLWSNILKLVNDDPVGFYENGGWSSVLTNGDISGSEDESEEESAFEAEGSDEEESSEDYSDEEEYDEDEDDEDGSEEEEEEDAMSWDEMEEHAVKQDEKKRKGR